MTAKNNSSNEGNESNPVWKNVLVEFDEGIAWVTLNRPEKRNAMSPELNREMIEILKVLEVDDRCKVLILTGAGDSFSSGMDLKEYFRETDGLPPFKLWQVRRESLEWHWRSLMYFQKPTIAMVNGWCFGGAFTPVVSCDLAFAADEAQFGLSEINWGIIPAGGVPRALAEVMSYRNALYYIMTGETFNGQKAAQMGLVNESVPREKLRERTLEVANSFLEKSTVVLGAAKIAFKFLKDMSWEAAFDYVGAKAGMAQAQDPEKSRKMGLSGFLDEKSYRPGLGGIKRDT
jgi:trans-feruloyl-CoA hydratase/vanillin synthase